MIEKSIDDLELEKICYISGYDSNIKSILFMNCLLTYLLFYFFFCFLFIYLWLFIWLTNKNSKGESFENGDAALYGAEKLLDWEVILVTFNYRLGVLGFLSTGDENASGNWGLYDQLMVLQWTRDHIESFSGNPNLVTIFGQGAGQ